MSELQALQYKVMLQNVFGIYPHRLKKVEHQRLTDRGPPLNLYQDVKLFNQCCMFKIIDPRNNIEHVSANVVSSFHICRVKEMILLEEKESQLEK